MTPEQIIAEARATQASMYKKKPAKRAGRTPEAKLSEQIDKYLERLDFYVIRTSAGLTEFDGRKVQIGRKGQHDRTCCAPNGAFVSIEIKSAIGTPSKAQERQRAFIERRNGLVIVARSVADVRSALVARFGEKTVRGWEAKR